MKTKQSIVTDDAELAAQLLGKTESPIYGKKARDLITGKRIIVTGAGGSIGSEIVCQIKRIDPNASVYFIDNDEYSLYRLQMKLTGQALLSAPEYILANIIDEVKMRQVFEDVKPDIVFHAAAHKHLPLLERSPEAAIRTNIVGTDVIARTCALTKVKYLINISTDKAARPTSILGLTKKIAEMTAASYANNTTTIASVRFGNVLGSRGSFVETLKYQVSRSLPITITDVGMTRYFMTIPEAAGLVIETAALAKGKKTYVLDMGDPILITELVDRYIRLTNSKLLKIIVSGIRSGEKMSEELFDPSERFQLTTNDRIFSVDVDAKKITKRALRNLFSLASAGASHKELKLEMESIITAVPKPRSIRQRTEQQVSLAPSFALAI